MPYTMRAKWLQTNSNFCVEELAERIEILISILTKSTSDSSARHIEENHGGKSTATRHRKQRRCTIAERN